MNNVQLWLSGRFGIFRYVDLGCFQRSKIVEMMSELNGLRTLNDERVELSQNVEMMSELNDLRTKLMTSDLWLSDTVLKVGGLHSVMWVLMVRREE